MANMHLVTGYAGQEHVTSADQGAFHSYLFGTDQFVFERGNKLAASVVSNNLIRVQDGDIYIQGRHVRLNEGTYVDLNIENGEQGMLRNDLIVARYTKDSITAVEEVNLVVIKGTSASSDPADPAYTEGDILGGAILHDMPLYRVPLDGLNVGELVPLFETFENTLPSIVALIRALNTAVSGKAAASHNHGTGDITSGILPVARGGTGVSSLDALAEKLPGIKMNLLWENASPTSSFAAQTVAVDLSGYDMVAIETYTPEQFFDVGDTRFNLSAAGASRLHFWPIGSPEKFNLSDFFADLKSTYGENFINHIMFNTRKAVVSRTAVDFELNTCLYSKQNNQQVVTGFTLAYGANYYNIPIKIYGIRGVQA